jgi:predicted RNA-binding Zn-ribbon protein involved in translation (DUF1610 family)
MAVTELDAVCRSCGARFRSSPKRTFLGFQRFVCPDCGTEMLYPLTNGYRTTYWVIVVFMGLSVIGSLAEGNVAFPGLLGVAVIVGLVRDRRIQKEVNNAAQGK